MSTALYQKYILGDDGLHSDLSRQVWKGNPWMISVYTGPGHPDPRDRDMLLWCHEQFGDETQPFGDEPIYRRWRRGGATVHGWTWYGFATEADMKAFEEAWPTPADVPLPSVPG